MGPGSWGLGGAGGGEACRGETQVPLRDIGEGGQGQARTEWVIAGNLPCLLAEKALE